MSGSDRIFWTRLVVKMKSGFGGPSGAWTYLIAVAYAAPNEALIDIFTGLMGFWSFWKCFYPWNYFQKTKIFIFINVFHVTFSRLLSCAPLQCSKTRKSGTKIVWNNNGHGLLSILISFEGLNYFFLTSMSQTHFRRNIDASSAHEGWKFRNLFG